MSAQKWQEKAYRARCALIELVLPEGHSVPGETSWAIRQAIEELEKTSRGHGRALQRSAHLVQAAEPRDELAAARARRQLRLPMPGLGPRFGSVEAGDIAAAWQAIEEREGELYQLFPSNRTASSSSKP